MKGRQGTSAVSRHQEMSGNPHQRTKSLKQSGTPKTQWKGLKRRRLLERSGTPAKGLQRSETEQRSGSANCHLFLKQSGMGGGAGPSFTYELPAISYQLSAMSHQLQATTYELPAISYQLDSSVLEHKRSQTAMRVLNSLEFSRSPVPCPRSDIPLPNLKHFYPAV